MIEKSSLNVFEEQLTSILISFTFCEIGFYVNKLSKYFLCILSCAQSLRKALWTMSTCADLKIYSICTFECFVPRLLFPRFCSITTFFCFTSLWGGGAGG